MRSILSEGENVPSLLRNSAALYRDELSWKTHPFSLPLCVVLFRKQYLVLVAKWLDCPTNFYLFNLKIDPIKRVSLTIVAKVIMCLKSY